MLLSLSLASFAAWRGLALSVAHASLGPGDVERLRWEALATGALFAAVGIVTARAGKKAHFEDVWVNAGALLVFGGLLSGVFGSGLDWGVWLVALLAVAAAVAAAVLPVETHAAVRAGRPRGVPRAHARGVLAGTGRRRVRGAVPSHGDARRRRARDDLPRPPAHEDSGEEEKISMKGEWVAAERVEEVRAAARGWKRAGAISSGTFEEILLRYPEPRTLPAPLWRLLTFVFGSFILLAFAAFFVLTVRPSGSSAWVLCAVLGVIFVVAADLQARVARHWPSAAASRRRASGDSSSSSPACSSYSKKIFISREPEGPNLVLARGRRAARAGRLSLGQRRLRGLRRRRRSSSSSRARRTGGCSGSRAASP